MKKLIGKILFGIIFIIIIPALLVIWARCTSAEIQLPVPANQVLNFLVMLIGMTFITLGMLQLWIYGKGLPMNAFPPKNYVKNGVFAITKNPIYLGTIISCFGLSSIMQSPSGFWFVSPVFTFMIIAYTVGFENERTLKLFGEQNYRPFLSLPEKSEQKLILKDRIAAFILTFIPWLLIYEAFIFAGVPKDAICTKLSFENQFPLIEFSIVFYVLAYLFALLIPFILKTKRLLREFETDVWFATGFSAFIYFSVPFIITQQDFIPQTFFGKLLLFDRSTDGESAAFPSFHVIWAFISARYFALSFKNFKWLWYLIAILISISCITTGNHSILDVLAGFCVFIILYFRTRLWNFIRLQSEHLANSWKEWKFGPVRIINHGFYAGAAGFTGTLIIGSFLGSENAMAGFITGISGIVGAALWAQFIEGSSKLQRPFGYYGSVAGVIICTVVIIHIFSLTLFNLLAAFAMAAPWIQILGRLRCLVQGCCHGKPTKKWLGLRYSHPNSRVNKISGLKEESLHPTQLYSIGTNLLTGLILIRMYNLNMSAAFITGMYLLINGLGRFVEEYFRGEVQTPYWAGMRIYQWLAIINIVMGIIFTSIRGVGLISFQLNPESLYWATAMGLFATVAYGVDFPNSNCRFARLTN